MAVTITSRQRAYIRKRTKIRELDPSEMVGELNIVPFLDIVVNIIMFLLATTAAVLSIAQIDAQLPATSPGKAKGGGSQSALNLNVTVTENGIIVAGSGGKLAPGCQNTTMGRVLTVPKLGGKYDWKGLTECVARVKSVPDFAGETQVIIGADPMIEYEHVVNAMDAVRSKGGEELFPDVLLSAGVR